MKNILFIAVLLLFVNCNRFKSVTTCDITTKRLESNHFFVRIIKSYSILNESSVSKNRCSFYVAIELGKMDTLNLIDSRSKIDHKKLQQYIEDSTKLVFFPNNQDSCVICSFSSSTNLDTLKRNVYVVGTLRRPIL